MGGKTSKGGVYERQTLDMFERILLVEKGKVNRINKWRVYWMIQDMIAHRWEFGVFAGFIFNIDYS